MTNQRTLVAVFAAIAMVLAGAVFLYVGGETKTEVITELTQVTATSSPAPATSSPAPATSTATPETFGTAYQITYADDQRAVWLAEVGTGAPPRKLLDEGPCTLALQLWSPTGDRFACADSLANRTLTSLTVVDDMGNAVHHVPNIRDFAWSPNGAHFAYLTGPPGSAQFEYQIVDKNGAAVAVFEGGDGNISFIGTPWQTRPKIVWSPDSSTLAYRDPAGSVAVYNLTSRQHRVVMQEAGYPIAWVKGGQTLVVATQFADCMRNCFKAILLDVASGRTRPFPPLDNSRDFWPSPDGNLAAVVTRHVDAAGQFTGIGLAILDFTTLSYNVISRSSISYPSEGIPPQHVVWTPDGAYVYWFHPGESWGAGGVYRVRKDGVDLTHVKDWGSYLFAGGALFSTDVKKVMVFLSDRTPPRPQTFRRVLDLETGQEADLGPLTPALQSMYGWRP